MRTTIAALLLLTLIGLPVWAAYRLLGLERGAFALAALAFTSVVLRGVEVALKDLRQ